MFNPMGYPYNGYINPMSSAQQRLAQMEAQYGQLSPQGMGTYPPSGGGPLAAPQVIPPDWVQYSRFDVTPQIRKQAVEKAFKDYKDWEMETLELYSQYSRTLAESGMLADSSMVADLVVEVSEELKDLDWRILQLKSLSYDPTEIMRLQEDIHHRYKKKMSKLDLSE